MHTVISSICAFSRTGARHAKPGDRARAALPRYKMHTLIMSMCAYFYTGARHAQPGDRARAYTIICMQYIIICVPFFTQALDTLSLAIAHIYIDR